VPTSFEVDADTSFEVGKATSLEAALAGVAAAQNPSSVIIKINRARDNIFNPEHKNLENFMSVIYGEEQL
jgi:hypothetical protein